MSFDYDSLPKPDDKVDKVVATLDHYGPLSLLELVQFTDLGIVETKVVLRELLEYGDIQQNYKDKNKWELT